MSVFKTTCQYWLVCDQYLATHDCMAPCSPQALLRVAPVQQYRVYVRSTICRYSAMYTKYTKYILTNIGHRLGHQSGLDESSGQHEFSRYLHGFAFRVYVVFSKSGKNIRYSQMSTKTLKASEETKIVSCFEEKTACGKPAQL